MGPTRPSMQELIGRRRRAGFVGRTAERAAFRGNFAVPAEDERHRFLFHVHGDAGVGKTRLVRELEQIAREAGALTAYVDEGVAGVPEAMTEMARQFASQGRRFKDLERLLAAHRERRHEAAAALAPGPAEDREGPSAGSLAVARAAQAGLGMIPVAGAFAAALDTDGLAHGADRLRARFRSQEDAQLVLSPEQVLTPVLLSELAGAADAVPWIVLLLDTYERTGPFLDPWLHDVMTTDRYGALPADVVVVTSGQHPFDTVRWGSFADFMTDLPLGPFTEEEARGLLADKGVRDEPVVAEVLRLTGGLPVLVSTLAESGPVGPGDVGDPSATAVDRFLKWERDPVRRAAALAGALPRRLDEDAFRSAVDGPGDQADALFAWLRGMPFVSEHGGRLRYHDVVRAPMLRLQRLRSPEAWTGRHTRLAEAYRRRRARAEGDLRPDEPWADEGWRELRLGETHHLLCARPRAALAGTLADLVTACGYGEDAVRPWVRVLAEAGEDTDAEALRTWGADLAAALAGGGLAGLLRLLLGRARGDEPWRATAWALRADALARDGAPGPALEDYDRALALDPALVRAHRGRAVTLGATGDYAGALAGLDRLLELEPDNAWNVVLRGEHHRLARHHAEAVADLSEGIARDPAGEFAWASRGAAHERHGDLDAALADFDRALALKPDYAWALARRARVWRGLGDQVRRLADLDRALALQPDWAWGRCERGDALRVNGRDTEALADYDRALELDPEYASAYASRGASLSALGRHEEALADLDRALALNPEYPWALETRARVRQRLADRALPPT
ncbi:tetratricopeptide repeat protein [Streptomyces sp. NPDC101237]|uniref:tetratricopeptide repeat protein n=1 Tax=Streptomyces sp. NPDC101237 TaxID=3366139 RepID=UPI0037F65082